MDRPIDDCLWAYLGAPLSAHGSDASSGDKAVVDRLASVTGRHIERYIVDDGRVTTTGCSVVLQRTIEEARTSLRRVTLLIAGTTCLGPSRQSRYQALAELLSAGLVVEDPSGSLNPTASTVALAKAIAKRRAWRKLLARRGTDG